jgi:hypothetical protein
MLWCLLRFYCCKVHSWTSTDSLPVDICAINYYDIYLPTDMIGKIATVRNLDNLIKKTTLIFRLTLNYDVKMDLNEIRCAVTGWIHTADNRILGTRYWVICMRNKRFIEVLSRYLLLKPDHVFSNSLNNS